MNESEKQALRSLLDREARGELSRSEALRGLPPGFPRVSEFSFDIDAEGEEQTANYLIPQRNQCRSCHERQVDGETLIVPIGPKARNLNRDYDYGAGVGTVNQLTRLADTGLLTGLPSLSEVDAAFDFAVIEADGVASLGSASLTACGDSGDNTSEASTGTNPATKWINGLPALSPGLMAGE